MTPSDTQELPAGSAITWASLWQLPLPVLHALVTLFLTFSSPLNEYCMNTYMHTHVRLCTHVCISPSLVDLDSHSKPCTPHYLNPLSQEMWVKAQARLKQRRKRSLSIGEAS